MPKFIVIILLALTLTACASGHRTGQQPPGTERVQPRRRLLPGGGSYIDPFQYCQAVGTIDQPDGRYTGPQVPESIARGLRKEFGLPEGAPLEPFLRNTHWRCMAGEVYACNVGANIPCMEQADTSRTPTQATTDFCKLHPNADVIPAYVTGRATIFEWGCKLGEPLIVQQVNEPDARGFLAKFWYKIKPS